MNGLVGTGNTNRKMNCSDAGPLAAGSPATDAEMPERSCDSSSRDSVEEEATWGRYGTAVLQKFLEQSKQTELVPGTRKLKRKLYPARSAEERVVALE